MKDFWSPHCRARLPTRSDACDLHVYCFSRCVSINGFELVVSDRADDKEQHGDAVCGDAGACTPRAGNSFWASRLSSPMNTARAIGRRRDMLAAENLNSQRDYAQVAGEHQHLCALSSLRS
ncbi:hypothetical protein TcCL_NonESM07297 [Trypanosoma cruzi]|nr:hypothetical protein TcCL_NonESM07297 [Trypanosoma cruzi]